MKGRDFMLNVDPKDGSIWLVHCKLGQPRKRIREMTDEILLALCADLSAALDEDNSIKSVERSVRFNDGMECKINVHLTALPDWAKRKEMQRQYEGIQEFGGMTHSEKEVI